MFAALLSWLNPANLIKILSLVQWFVQGSVALFKMFTEKLKKDKQNAVIDDIKKAESKIDDASKTDDDKQRLKEKADAVKSIENSLSPKP